MAMECVGVNTCNENAPDSDLAELPSVLNSGIVVVGSVDDHIQSAAQSRPFHGGFYICGHLCDSDSHPGYLHGRDGNPEPKGSRTDVRWARIRLAVAQGR